MAKGVVVKTVINQMIFDGATKGPMQKAVRDALLSRDSWPGQRMGGSRL
jgi:putative DNA-invertase from lambdoid prophage Rac